MKTASFTIPEKLLSLQNKLFELRKKEKLLLQNGDVGLGSAPSNIALVKYWGKSKTQFQIPDNPSLSFTLNHFRSNTKVTVLGRFFPEGEKPDFVPEHEFYLTDSETKSQLRPNDKLVSNMTGKLNLFLKNTLFPFATDIGLKIESYNNFPTACGLASSASGMAALCFAIANLLNLEKHFTKSELQYWLAEWSRLGSGSAARSTCMQKNSKFVSWELNPIVSPRGLTTGPRELDPIVSPRGLTTGPRELDPAVKPRCHPAGTTIKNVPYHKNWNKLRHCVFVLNSHPKDITSSDGHAAANNSPLHVIRVNYVKENFTKFKKALKDFDFEYISSFTENDAIRMHAVMQTSTPPALYLNHEVSFVIAEFIKFRQKEKLKAFWTLDAGPNIHFLYLSPHHQKLVNFHKEITLKTKLDSGIKIL